jgi:XRE family transcriptional regulator, aerobic/anaerobic benzoate catabolism transcriptional regulator
MPEHDPKTMLLKALGAQVRALRLRALLTNKEFAARASLSQRFLIQLESGHANISIAALARVARALGCSLHELVPSVSDDRSPHSQLWHWLSQCDDCELQELERWVAPRISVPPRRFVALIGLRGAGKSTVGPLLAAQLKTEFVELDTMIEQTAGMSLGEVFTLHGEDYYRRLERVALHELLARARSCVMTTGGSLVTDAESWALVKRSCFTVWLHATPREFMKRLRGQGDIRPMKDRPSAMAELKSLLAGREPLYAQATLMVKTTNKSPTKVVTQIIKAVAPADLVKSSLVRISPQKSPSRKRHRPA